MRGQVGQSGNLLETEAALEPTIEIKQRTVKSEPIGRISRVDIDLS